MELKQINTRYIFLVSIASAMGGYLFGFDFAVITGGLPFLREQFALDAYWEGFTTGSLALGCILGCLIAGKISDSFGRRYGLMIAASVFALSSLLMGIAPGLGSFIFFRFMAGIGVGMASLLSPVYIAEIAPSSIRGKMVAINQLTIVLGQVITHTENYWLRQIGPEAWRWMFGMGVVPSLLFLAGVIFLPETPRWLIMAKNDKKAEDILLKIGGKEYAYKTFNEIKGSIINTNDVSFSSILSRSFFPLLLTGIGLAVFQQFCGINVVFNYTTNIFQSIGASRSEQLIQAVWISLVNLVFTVLAMNLVDKWGRKPLMLLGAISLAIIYFITGYLLKEKNGEGISPFILTAIAVYAVSLAPVTWILISEIFPNKIRGIASAIAVVSLWVAYFILVFTFPIISETFGNASAFWVYSIICIAGFLFILIKVKETKGKSLEEIEHVYIK